MKLTGAGLSPTVAQDIFDSFDGLTKDGEKWQAIAGMGNLTDEQKRTAIRAVDSGSTFSRAADVGAGHGLSVKEISDFYYSTLPQYDQPTESGTTGTYSNKEIQTALDSTGLSTEQKAALWQLFGTHSGKDPAKKNPYSYSIGAAVAREIAERKAQG